MPFLNVYAGLDSINNFSSVRVRNKAVRITTIDSRIPGKSSVPPSITTRTISCLYVRNYQNSPFLPFKVRLRQGLEDKMPDLRATPLAYRFFQPNFNNFFFSNGNTLHTQICRFALTNAKFLPVFYAIISIIPCINYI